MSLLGVDQRRGKKGLVAMVTSRLVLLSYTLAGASCNVVDINVTIEYVNVCIYNVIINNSTNEDEHNQLGRKFRVLNALTSNTTPKTFNITLKL